VASHPEFQALIAQGRRTRAGGQGLSAAQVFDASETNSERAVEAAAP
jgi:hypothetical protein